MPAIATGRRPHCGQTAALDRFAATPQHQSAIIGKLDFGALTAGELANGR
mgnify:CR=1 FL=1